MMVIIDNFENRIFLTATPHNGYTQSFTALLELLDPLRFSRGPIQQQTEQCYPHTARTKYVKNIWRIISILVYILHLDILN